LSDALVWFMMYIDDIMILGLGRRRLALLADCVLEVIAELGFTVNSEKDQAGTSVVALGLGFHLGRRLCYLKPGRAEKVTAAIDVVLQNRHVDTAGLSRLVGQLAWSGNVVPGMARRLAPVRRLMHAAETARDSGCPPVAVPVAAAAALRAIRASLAGSGAVPLYHTSTFTTPADTNHIWFATDAAREADASHGLGGFYRGQWFYVAFRDIGGAEFISIGAAEALAIAVGLELFGAMMRDQCADVFVDNTAAAALVNKGYSPNPQMAVVGERIALVCAIFNIRLRAIGVRSDDNKLADSSSRNLIDGPGGIVEEASKPENGSWPASSLHRREAVRVAAPLAAKAAEARIDALGREKAFIPFYKR
jgi:hypothetical protein